MARDTVTIDSATSVLTQDQLDIIYANYFIPEDLHLELPGPNDTIKDSLDGKIGLYTRFFDFANFRIPLSPFLVDVLRYFWIHLSQLSVIGANTLCCYTKVLDSLNNWNNKFFRIDKSVIPPPSVNQFDAEECQILSSNPLPFKKLLELFLYGFVCLQTADIVLVVDEENNVVAGGNVGSSVAAPLKRVGSTTGRKSLEIIQRLARQSSLSVEAEVSAPSTTPFITTSLTPSPAADETDLVSRSNLHHIPASKRFVIIIDSSSESASKTDDSSPSRSAAQIMGILTDSVFVAIVLVVEAGVSFAPVHGAGKTSISLVKEFNVGASRHAAMNSELRVRYEQALRLKRKFKNKYVKSYDLVQERYVKVTSLKTQLEVREAEAASLRTQLELKEAEAAEAIRLRCQVYDLEAAAMLKVDESATLGVRNAKLMGEEKLRKDFEADHDEKTKCIRDLAAQYSISIDMDKDLFPSMLTAIAGRRWVIGHGLRLAVMKYAESSELLSLFGNVFGLAIDSERYQASLDDLKDLSFPLLDQLEVKKDAPIERIKAYLYLEGSHGEEDTPEWFPKLQPSSSQFKVPVYHERTDVHAPLVVDREVLLDDSITANVTHVEQKRKDTTFPAFPALEFKVASPVPTFLALEVPSSGAESNAPKDPLVISFALTVDVSNYNLAKLPVLNEGDASHGGGVFGFANNLVELVDPTDGDDSHDDNMFDSLVLETPLDLANLTGPQ
ncbi:hypothetical protein Tco_0818563 [Tanacetum coccineum]